MTAEYRSPFNPDRDESLVLLPHNYRGPAILDPDTDHLPVWVTGNLGEFDGHDQLSVRLNLINGGRNTIERCFPRCSLRAKPSDVANFLNKHGKANLIQITPKPRLPEDGKI